VLFFIVFLAFVFFAPEGWGYFIEQPNFDMADPLKTPDHIAPVWYYTPFYSMLRAATYPLFTVPAKFWGLVVMAGAIIIPCAMPWLDRSPVKSIRYKGNWSKFMLGLLVVSFFVLGYLGTKGPTDVRTAMAQFFTITYFAYFVLMPWYTRIEKTKPEPDRVTG
jgi:ubiquinol-cytochrome c reductase cytochrome b subunit